MPNKPPRDKPRRPRSGRPRALGDVLQRATTGSALAAIQQGAAGVDALRQKLLSQLPQARQPHVASAIAKPGEVVVFVDSAAWAGRLKLALAEVRPDLKPEAQDSDRLTVKVMPGGQFRR